MESQEQIVTKAIIVPVDFTEKCEYALQHALFLSKIFNRPIVGLHIIKKDKYLEEAKNKLNEWKENIEKKYNVTLQTYIRKGSIFKGIKNFCKEIDGLMIIMGLHNPKRAMKTIVGSARPFLVVQDQLRRENIVDVVVPFDYKEDARVQLNWAIFLFNHFHCNINIFKPFISDNALNDKMKKNILFIRDMLDSRGIVYGIRTAKRGVKFNEAIYDFAKEINADMIFIMSYDFKKFILKAEKFNMKIPVLCVNPAATKFLPGKFV
ncbi:MAG: universal stress protein [Bacteroidales bacterium]|nr:universal stress protein [Bacteroidales bacterium]